MPIAIGAYSVPSPTGKVKAVVPALVIGPSTKLAVLPPVEDAVLVRDNIQVEVVITLPSVKVNAPVTVIGTLARVIKSLPAVPVRFIVTLPKVVEVVPLIDKVSVPLKVTLPELAV